MAIAEAGVLFVCHANICRSPMAERLARHALATHSGAAASPIPVSSAGTHTRAGYQMHPDASRVLRELGADDEGFASRPLTADLVSAAALILTATRGQRAVCATLAPAAIRRVFTVRQFGRLTAAVDPARIPTGAAPARIDALLAEFTAVRGRLQPVPGDEDDLADPVLGPAEAFLTCAEEIKRCVVPAVKLIAPA